MGRVTSKLSIAAVVCGILASAVVMGAAADAPDLLEALKSGDESARLAAIDALGLRGHEIEGAMPALIGQLGDASPAVRAHAAHALGRIGPAAKPAAKALVALVGDKDKRVRREAVRALRNIRPGPDVTIPLFDKLLRDAEPEVRLHVMDAMAEEGKAVVPPLIEALKHKEACYWSCLVLAEIGPDADAAVPALTRVARCDRRPEVRREAILALAAIGPKASPAVPSLICVLKCDEVNVGPAVFALGSIGPKAKGAQRMVKQLADDKDSPALRQTVCLWALARMDPGDEQLVRRVVQRLVDALKSPEPQLRSAAARALIDLDPDPEITRPLLKKAMEDSGPEVLDDILDALASIGEKAVPRLTEALKHEEVRAEAASIIARIGPPAKAAVPALTEALGDKNPQTRSEVLFAVAAIGPDAKQAVPAATRLLSDPDMEVRYAACYALGKIGPAAMPAKAELQQRLGDPDQFLAMASAWALACIHPECTETAEKSVPALIKALAEPDPMTRVHAAQALQRLGPLAKPAAGELQKALKDENKQVRDTAAEALKAIGS